MGRPLSLRDSLLGLGRLTRRFWPYVRRERPLIMVSLLALYAEIVLRLLEPWPLKWVLDRVAGVTRHRGLSRLPFLDALDPPTLLALSAVAVIVFAGLRALAAYYNTVGFALVGNRVLTTVRNELYGQLQRLSLSFHTRARSGDLLVRVTGDVGFLQDVAVTALLPLLANALTLVGMAAVMLWLNAPLTLIALATGPLFWASTTRLTRRIRETARRQRQQEGAMAATAAESIGAVKVIHALSLEGTFAQAFTGQSRKNLATGVRATRLSAGLERTVDLLIAVATAAVLWYGARLALRGVMTPGDLVVFLAYLKNAFRPVRDFVKYTGRLAKASAAGERVLDLLDRTPDVRDLPGAVLAGARRTTRLAGPPARRRERGGAAARLANAHAFVEALPKGYDTMVGERGVTLSNGQRQRIAIARAAIRRAPVLILDEPTTGLDGENERAVIEALERLAEGRTTFLITHDLLLAARADVVLYLEAGRLRECGSHAQLLQAGGQYALLYNLQTAGGDRGTTPQRYDAVTT